MEHQLKEEKKIAEEIKVGLKDEIRAICDILFIAQENLKICEYFYKIEENQYVAVIKSRSSFLGFSRIMSWRTVVNELYKLFAPQEHYSISKFLKKLETGEFEGVIVPTKIEEWQKKIDALISPIKKLKNQRNKKIAHSDRDGLNEEKNAVYLKEAFDLIAIVQDIAKEIYYEVNKSHFAVENPLNAPVEDLRWIVEQLAQKRQMELQPLVDECKAHGVETD